ncbi:MAG: pitrilysin family protein [Candidatus Buchananbacteria bacterium]|nr:pitrilysin family protein [Candidatus Buchananbacteria bacterium]
MYQKTIWPNKVRLITAPLKETQTANLLVLFKVGSRDENNKVNGGSHFIEHLMFKGTKKRPTALDLSKELDGIGAEFNAFTGKDYTGYYIKSDAKHLSLAIDVLSDMLLNAKFDDKEIKRERGVIIEEINMYEDNPMMYINDLLEQIMYAGHQLGKSIAGTRETVKKMSRSDLISYRNKFYNGSNVVICLSGNFNDSHLKELKDKFKFKKTATKNPFNKIKIKASQPQVAIKFKETEQTQIALGFPAYPYADKRLYALQLLSVVLGGNMSSRLFLQIRERNGLAYFVRSFLSVYEDTGALIIQSGLDKSRVESAIAMIIAELKKMKKGVTAEELKRAKEYLFGRTALDLEDTSHISQWYGQQELMIGKILTPEEKNKKIAAVKNSDIIAVAKDIININKASLAIIGPFKDEKKFKNLLK